MHELLLATRFKKRLKPNDPGYTVPLADTVSSGDWGSQVNMIADPPNNCIYLLGGYTSGSAMNKEMARYDIATNTYTKLNPVPPNETRNLGLGIVDGKLYAIRNLRIDIYDIASNSWTAKVIPSNPSTFNFNQPAATVVGTDIYLFGYPTDYNTHGNVLVKYDTVNNVWTHVSTLRKLPLAAYPVMHHHNGELFISGAAESNNSDIHVYHIANNTWRIITGGPVTYAATMVPGEEGLYVLHTTDKYRNVSGFTYTDEQFTDLPDMPYLNSSGRAAVAVGRIAYCWGRLNASSPYRLTSYRLERQPPRPPDTGPGPKSLIGGTLDAGFYGETTAAELIGGLALATLVNYTAGTQQNDLAGWLKFAIDGKTVFIAKRTFRYGITANSLKNASKDIITGSTEIELDGRRYKVRLPGGFTPPYKPGVSGSLNAWTDPKTNKSEWNRLMYHIVGKPFTNTNTDLSAEGITEGDWAKYKEDDLFIATTNGGASFCMEQSTNGPMVCRGQAGTSYVRMDSYTSYNSMQLYNGWRPVLELIPEPEEE